MRKFLILSAFMAYAFVYEINCIYAENSTKNNEQDAQVIAKEISNKLSLNANDIIKNYYPSDIYSMFKQPVDANKWSENTIRVDFKLSADICQAILDRNANTLSNLILADDSGNAPDFRRILEEYIAQMIASFSRQDDLKIMKDYVTTMKDGSYYRPSSSLKEYLLSQPYWKDIEEIAKSYVEKSDNETIAPVYELRMSLYFDALGKSRIDIPAANQLDLMVNLEKCSKIISDLVTRKQEELVPYKDKLDSIKKISVIENEIENIKKEITEKSVPLQKEIDELTNKITETKKQLTTKKNELKQKETALQNEPATINNNNFTNLSNVRRNRNMLSSTPNPKIDTLKNEINTINSTIKSLTDQITQDNEILTKKQNELETYRAPLKGKEQEKETLKLDEETRYAIKFINNKYNPKIEEQIKKMKQIFNTSMENNGAKA